MRQIHRTIPAALEALLAPQPLTPAKIDFAWRVSVGPALARATAVSRETDGTLRVVADGAHWRREVRRAAPLIEARLARLLGAGVVTRVRVDGEA